MDFMLQEMKNVRFVFIFVVKKFCAHSKLRGVSFTNKTLLHPIVSVLFYVHVMQKKNPRNVGGKEAFQ